MSKKKQVANIVAPIFILIISLLNLVSTTNTVVIMLSFVGMAGAALLLYNSFKNSK